MASLVTGRRARPPQVLGHWLCWRQTTPLLSVVAAVEPVQFGQRDHHSVAAAVVVVGAAVEHQQGNCQIGHRSRLASVPEHYQTGHRQLQVAAPAYFQRDRRRLRSVLAEKPVWVQRILRWWKAANSTIWKRQTDRQAWPWPQTALP